MFFSRNKENNVYPCKPQFYYIKVGFKGVQIIQVCFRDGFTFFHVFFVSKGNFFRLLLYIFVKFQNFSAFFKNQVRLLSTSIII